MEIIIHQAILHVLDTTLDAPVLSGSCMEPTAEKMAYLQYHIEKLLASDDIRQCRPLPDSAFQNELEQNKDFVDLSCRIAGVLFDYMHAHTTIPGADLAVVDFTRDGEPWLGILKLNYKNGYTHYTEEVGGAPVNSIIQQRACLPTQSGKVEEGALVDLTDYSMRLLEKKYDIDGHKEFYLSTVVFQYTQAEPEKKKLQAIQEAAAQAVKDSYADEPHAEAQVAMLIANQASDNDNKVTVEQVRRQLAEDYPLAAVPFDDYVEKSDVLEPAMHDQPVTVTPARIRRMESRSIHTANGIEVKIPTEMLSEDSAVEFLHDADGSVSLLMNKGIWIVSGVLLVLQLLIIYAPFMQLLFGTTALPLRYLIITLIIGFVMFLIVWIARRILYGVGTYLRPTGHCAVSAHWGGHVGCQNGCPEAGTQTAAVQSAGQHRGPGHDRKLLSDGVQP